MSDTPRTDQQNDDLLNSDSYTSWLEISGLARQLERELNAANSKIESLNRGNSNAERILCELTGCESGRDVPDWIVKKNWELTDLANAYLELVHNHTLSEERIKRLEEMYEGEIGENEQFLGSNLQGLLTRELNWSKERIKRLEDIIEKASEHFRRAGPNAFTAYEMADVLKEAKP